MKSPRALGLPYDDWRPGQRYAIRTIQFTKTTHTVINAPTGAGKSTIAAALPRLDPKKRHVTLTATRLLQDQYGGAFPFLSDLRGMSNYPCRAAKAEFKAWFPKRRGAITCDEGPCHVGISCALKEDGCDYFDERRAFVSANAGLTNYAAWLSNRRWGAGTSPLGQADRLLCDEAHDLPEQLMSACRIDVPGHLIDARKVPRRIRDWRNWATQKIGELAPGDDDDTRLRRERTERNLRQLAHMDRAWAWDQDERGFHFEPTIPRLLMPLLHTDDGQSTVIYLSATITPATLSLLDIDPATVTFETMRSHFPVERRPIYILPGVRVDFRSMQDRARVGRWLDRMSQFASARDDRRGIIHSVSFERAYQIAKGLQVGRRPIIVHQRGETAGQAIARFRKAGPCAILISPSVTTGVDFAYADAEFQIIPKLPFPDTRSAIMRARIRATPRYRDHVTMTTLVQACGRIVRASDDQGETAIFDEHFHWWYPQNRDLAASWFDDAIVYTRKQVQPLDKWVA